MATDIARLSSKIFDILDDYDNITPEQKTDARQQFSDDLAAAIIEEIKSLGITYTTGLTAGANAVTGVFNYTTE